MHEPCHLCLDGEVIEVFNANAKASDAGEEEHPLKAVSAVLEPGIPEVSPDHAARLPLSERQVRKIPRYPACDPPRRRGHEGQLLGLTERLGGVGDFVQRESEPALDQRRRDDSSWVRAVLPEELASVPHPLPSSLKEGPDLASRGPLAHREVCEEGKRRCPLHLGPAEALVAVRVVEVDRRGSCEVLNAVPGLHRGSKEVSLLCEVARLRCGHPRDRSPGRREAHPPYRVRPTEGMSVQVCQVEVMGGVGEAPEVHRRHAAEGVQEAASLLALPWGEGAIQGGEEARGPHLRFDAPGDLAVFLALEGGLDRMELLAQRGRGGAFAETKPAIIAQPRGESVPGAPEVGARDRDPRGATCNLPPATVGGGGEAERLEVPELLLDARRRRGAREPEPQVTDAIARTGERPFGQEERELVAARGEGTRDDTLGLIRSAPEDFLASQGELEGGLGGA